MTRAAVASLALFLGACTSIGGLSGGGGQSDAEATDAGGSDGASATDAGVSRPSSSASIDCNGVTCQGKLCCFGRDAGSYTCADSCGAGELAIPCDDATDCTTGLCCVSIDGKTNFASSVACRSSCPYTSGLETNLCQDQASCPNGGSCTGSDTILPKFSICK